MLEISKNANSNYLCKIVELKNLRKHENADRLQIATIDFQDVITGLDATEGDIYVYFPVECKINPSFLAHTSSYRDSQLNHDQEKAGFFEDNCRVKAVKLRGHRSMGYIVPFETVYLWSNNNNFDSLLGFIDREYTGQEFDTINGKLLVEKYVIKTKEPRAQKQGKKARVSRLVENQFRFHVDTENFRRNAYKINPLDEIEVTYKLHGTSWWKSNVLVKRKLSRFEKLLKWLGVNIITEEYDQLYGSRKVVKNEYLDDEKKHDHYFGFDLWKVFSDKIGDIPKGFTIYGEAVGYTPEGGAIQKGYDYGCRPCEFELYVYRITYTNPDGVSFELSYDEIYEFCQKYETLKSPELFYKGKAARMYDLEENDHWHENFIQRLEKDYNDKDCYMCENKVPEEGICIRKVLLTDCEIYKLKSFSFLEHESKQLDTGESDLESDN